MRAPRRSAWSAAALRCRRRRFKGSFRGLAGLGDKDLLEYTPYAYDMQLATLRAIVHNMVLPWEEAGFHVHIFLHTYSCIHCQATHQMNYLRAARNILGRHRRTGRHRVVVTNVTTKFADMSGNGYGQTQAARIVFSMLKQHMDKTHMQFRSVLLHRWDVVPYKRLSKPEYDYKRVIEDSLLMNPKNLYTNKAIHYLSWSTTHACKSVNDLSFSIPGWQMPCFFNITLHSDTHFWAPGGGFELPSWSSEALQIPYDTWEACETGTETIYRGPYGVSHHDGGKFICRLLQQRFNGSSCGPTRVFKEICTLKKVNNDDTCARLVEQFAKEDETRERGEDGKHCRDNALHITTDEMYSTDELRHSCGAQCSSSS